MAEAHLKSTGILTEYRWHEHDPLELLQTVETCIEKATEQFTSAGNHISQIRSVGITNQRETLVLWDKHTGEPLHNAVVWPDTRTASLVRELKNWDGADKLQDLCGLPLSTYPSSVKLVWLLRHVEPVKKAYEEGRLVFGTVDSWLIFKLNGGMERKEGPLHVTDSTNASRTMFMNIHKLEYDDTLLNFFKLDRSKITLPKIIPSSHATAYGNLTRGPLKGVPIAGCLGDQSAALVGQCGFKPGQAKNTYGTGCFLLYNCGTEPVISKNGLLATVAYDFGQGQKPVYALEGSIAVGGSGITFLQNNLGIVQSSKEVDTVANTVSDNGGVYFVTAFSGLFAPYWIDDAKGTMCKSPASLHFRGTVTNEKQKTVGITAHTQKGHITRATLEATCHQTAAILDAMATDSGHPLEALAVDGGLSNSDLCMQIQADVSGIRVDRPAMRETTALGAAVAAGLATGVWESLDDLREVNKDGRTAFEPKIGEQERKRVRGKWEQAVSMSKGWIREDLDGENA